MPQANLDIVRGMYEESARGRVGASWHLLDPDIEYERRAGEGDVLTGSWRGLDAMAAALREYVETFEDLRVVAERYIEAGDSVVVFTRHIGVARASGLPFDERFADVLTLRDGRVVRLHAFRHRADALASVGLGEAP